jgi:hypothetical protein
MDGARAATRRGFGWAAAVLLACGAAQANQADPTPRRQEVRTPPPPLSAEDAALVKELALLERVELLRNLELFERGAEEEASADGAARPEGG